MTARPKELKEVECSGRALDRWIGRERPARSEHLFEHLFVGAQARRPTTVFDQGIQQPERLIVGQRVCCSTASI